MNIGEKGLELISSFEGCRLTAYKNPGERYYTIGYGHYGADVKEGQKITKVEALSYLKKDLATTISYVNKYVKSFKPNQNQFDALASYCYNRGPKGLKELCDHSKTAEDFSKNILIYWGSNISCKAGLLKRRKAEQQLFNIPCDKSGYKAPDPGAVIKKGAKGESVKWIQSKLNAYKKNMVKVDGIFGNDTVIAVKIYQAHKGLTSDGVVGSKTIARLKNER